MYGVTDIPDWCFVESGMTYDPAKPATAEAMAMFNSHSPTTLADKVSPSPRLSLSLSLSLSLCISREGNYEA
jgi:hypothetical protein